MSMLFDLICLIVVLGIIGLVVIVVYATLKPTDDTKVVVEERLPLQLESLTDTEAVFSTKMPLRNSGVEDAAITDVFARPFLPQEQFPDAVAYGHVERETVRRQDNYIEAFILNANSEQQLIVTLRYVARNNKNIKEVLSHMVDMDTVIYCVGMARKAIYTKKFFFTVDGTEISALVGGADNGR